MTRKYKDIFKRLILEWPTAIDVHEKAYINDERYRIPNLITIHDSIEQKLIDRETDMDVFQVDWAIYTVLCGLAKDTDNLNVSSLNFEMIEKVLLENLE